MKLYPTMKKNSQITIKSMQLFPITDVKRTTMSLHVGNSQKSSY